MDARSALLGERIARHGMSGHRVGAAVEAVAVTTALQAQDPAASRLGVRTRSTGLTEADVVHAIEVERSLVRTWLLRGTIHLVTAADVRWLVQLIGPVIAHRFRTRWRQLGLHDALLERVLSVLPMVLNTGPRTRTEIRVALAEAGVVVDLADPQAITHVLLWASTTGLVCRGPDRGRDATFALLEDWLPVRVRAPPGPTGDDALAELARRYFTAYSPATGADFTTWSGLPAARALELLRSELTPVDVDGAPGFRLGRVEPARATRLLPAFDNYLIGYRDRRALLTGADSGRIFRGGMISPTVLLDGRVIGIWAVHRPSATVRVELFGDQPQPVLRDVRAEAADIGRFLGREVNVSIAGSP